MPSQFPPHRNVVSQILGISALIAVLIASGCTSSKGSGGGSGGGTGGTPALSAVVGAEHFSSGQQGATYGITVSNTGTAATSGPVTVVDPPTGFTVTAIRGAGFTTPWTCTLATLTCTTSAVLPAGQSFPPITVIGNVTSANGTRVTIPLTLALGSAAPVTVTPTPTLVVAPVALSIAKWHTGTFTQGQSGATYSLNVSNGANAGTTSGAVTVTEIPPTGMTVTGMAGGTGSSWACVVATLSCTRSNALPAGSSSGPITVTVNVAANAGSPLTNQASVSGGNQTTVVTPASDSTIIMPPPALQISKSHTGSFTQGQIGATYSVTVNNTTGAGPTSGTVTVTEAPPSGLSVTGMAGAGGTGSNWACAIATLTCTRSDALAGGASYDPITVTANVNATASSPQVNKASVSGGGSAGNSTTDSTTIVSPTCSSLGLLGNESLLNGTYVVALNGWEDGVGPSQTIGAFAANGTGGVTIGELDSGKVVVGAPQSAPKLETISGCFQVGPDLHGLMIWNLNSGGSETFSFVLSSDGSFADILEFDDQNPGTSPGMRASGDFNIEVGGPFNLASFSGPFGFEAKGYSPNSSNTDYLRERKIGRFDDSTSGVVTNGAADAAIATGTGTQTNIDNQSFTGNFTAPDSLGRGTATFTYPNFNNAGPLTLNFAYYLNDASDLVMVSTDTPDNSGHAMDHGFVTTQLNGPYGAGSLSGNSVFYMIGADLSANHSFTVAGVGQVAGDGLGGASVRLDEISNGSVVATGTNAISGGSFTVSPNGMGVLTIGSGGAARKFSVAMYDKNFGNMLEGTAASPGSNLIIGEFRAQTAPVSGFADGTFSGPYGIGTNRQASAISTFEVGTVTTPTPQTNPPSFSGAIDRSSGNGCNTGCLSSNLAVSATFSVDANGRITIAPTSGGGGPAFGWFRNKGNGFWIISDTSDVNATILN